MFPLWFTNLNLPIVFEIINHTYFIPCTPLQVPITGLLSSSLFISALIMSAEPSTEQAIKALQAQNAQFQELFMNLAKGQQDLKTLILKERRRRRRGPSYLTQGTGLETGYRMKLIWPPHLEGKIVKRKGGLLALWSPTTRRISMKNSILLLRISTNS